MSTTAPSRLMTRSTRIAWRGANRLIPSRYPAVGLFDVLAHFDLPKKFGFLPEEDISDLVGETLDLVKERDLAIEVSSAGLRKPVGEIYPSAVILREMKKRGIPIVLSSDAHDPSEVGIGYEETIPFARSAGYDSLVTFDDRRRTVAPIG